MIQPTIGRVVLYHAAGSDKMAQPNVALVAFVHGDTLINVGGFDANGVSFSATSVVLLQDSDEPPAAGPWAEWMPYQKGQAAKYDELTKQTAEKAA